MNLYTYSLWDDEWHFSHNILNLGLFRLVEVLRPKWSGGYSKEHTIKMFWNCRWEKKDGL